MAQINGFSQKRSLSSLQSSLAPPELLSQNCLSPVAGAGPSNSRNCRPSELAFAGRPGVSHTEDKSLNVTDVVAD